MNYTIPTRALPTPLTTAQLLAARLVNEKADAFNRADVDRAHARERQMDLMTGRAS